MSCKGWDRRRRTVSGPKGLSEPLALLGLMFLLSIGRPFQPFMGGTTWLAKTARTIPSVWPISRRAIVPLPELWKRVPAHMFAI